MKNSGRLLMMGCLIVHVNGQYIMPDVYHFSFDNNTKLNSTADRDCVNRSIVNFPTGGVINHGFVSLNGTGHSTVQGSQSNNFFITTNQFTVFFNFSVSIVSSS